MYTLISGHYPILNKYPQFVVDYRKRETDKIRQREVEFLKSKKEANVESFQPLANVEMDAGELTVSFCNYLEQPRCKIKIDYKN